MKPYSNKASQFLAGIKPRLSGTAGHVSLVGAGPGDPQLLTIKAMQCLNTADIIFYDRLVSEDIRALFPANTPAIYVGKAKGRHAIFQHELNNLLIETANMGLRVCRLKGGDAFVFGRGGEEMLALKKAGVYVEVVPGITSGAGATAYAGIPLTHRGLTQGVSFITAHGEKELHTHWKAITQSGHTLVFYMGLSSAAKIQHELVAAGMPADKPVAVIERGCSANQRVVTGDLCQLGDLVNEHNMTSPALIVVGDVVSLREQLAWFETDSVQQTNACFTEAQTPFEQKQLTA